MPRDPDLVRVYVPAGGAVSVANIDAGSGLVGTPSVTGERVTIDYEGNRFGASNLVTYADRVWHAHGRHVEDYPTVARSFVPAADVVEVGHVDLWRGVVALDGDDSRELVARWLDIDVDALDDELACTNFTHTAHRRYEEMVTSGDPQQQAMAHEWKRRAPELFSPAS